MFALSHKRISEMRNSIDMRSTTNNSVVNASVLGSVNTAAIGRSDLKPSSKEKRYWRKNPTMKVTDMINHKDKA